MRNQFLTHKKSNIEGSDIPRFVKLLKLICTLLEIRMMQNTTMHIGSAKVEHMNLRTWKKGTGSKT